METNYKEIHELIARSVALRNDLMKAGLLKTFHAFDTVIKQIGWEAAEILEGKHPTKLKSKQHHK